MTRFGIAAFGVVATLLAALAPALSSPAQAASTPSTPKAPAGLVVARDTAALDDLRITWKAVPGVDHYMVRVNNGSTDTNHVVDATQTSFTHQGDGVCTRYKVWVAAVAADGSSASTGFTYVQSLAPGGVTGLRGLRSEAGAVATVSWAAPANPGRTPVTGYRVAVTELASGKTLVSRNSLDAVEQVKGLDPSRMYVAKVSAHNAFGACVQSTFMVGNNRPSPPAFTVVRDTADATEADVTWTQPSWQGYGVVTSYVIGYKNVLSKDFTWIKADAQTRAIDVPKLDPTVDWQFVARAYSSDDVGLLSKVITLRKAGYNPINASVKVSGADDTIDVQFSAPVGSTTNYPRATVSVAKANGTAGWTDTHTVTNGAGLVRFLPVPCGTYAVTVTGVGATAVQELVRTTARVCELPQECFVSTLANGGFETPVLPAKSYRIMAATTPDLVWNNTAEAFVELWSTGFGGVPSFEGNQFAELNANKAGTLYQDLTTVPGTTMRWHLRHRGRTGVDTMRVMIGTPKGALVQNGPNLVDGKTAWGLHTYAYTIPAGQTVTRFAFQAVNAGSYGNFLDDVVFTPESCQ
jgi:Fibronectin type III domain